jgi:hypothetical protein
MGKLLQFPLRPDPEKKPDDLSEYGKFVMDAPVRSLRREEQECPNAEGSEGSPTEPGR